MLRPIALALALALLSCAGSLRSQAHAISDRAAEVIDAGTHTMLAVYCAQSMLAIGRTGTLTDGHCRESGARTGTPATETELAALATLRTKWAPVLAAAEVVTRLHDTLRGTIEGVGSVSDGQILTAIGQLAAAYESLRQAATEAGLSPPLALSLEAP